MVVFESKCKVCSSDHRKLYEDFYMDTSPKPSWASLEDKAQVLGESISYKSFERHFTRHFNSNVAEMVEAEEEVGEVVEGARKEVIDTVTEIKNNLQGLKTLLDVTLGAYQDKTKPPSPTMLRGLTELYREHRQTIEACDRLTSKLTAGSNLSEAELLKILYLFSKDFCPDCMTKFKDNLDTYLKRKGIDKQSS